MALFPYRRLALLPLLWALCLSWPQALAQPDQTGAQGGSGMVMNMRNAEIRAFLQWVSDYTGRNLIVHRDVQGEVTVLSTRPVNPDQAWQLFLATMEVYGYAAVDSPGGVKILPQNLATSAGATLRKGSGGELVVELIQATTVPAVELANTLRPLIPPSGLLAAYPQTNSLIVSASAAQVERIRELIRQFESQAGFDFEPVRLRHASAEEVAESITRLVPNTGEGGGFQFVKLSVDPRTNSILLSGPRENREQIKGLIRSLDQEVDEGVNTQVIYLQYVEAEEMLQILNGVAQSLQPEGRERSRQITIEASASTNALVVNAPPAVTNQMRRIVEQIDIRRDQVLVEALVVEVTEDVAEDLGVSWVSKGGERFGDDGTNIGVSTLGNLPPGALDNGDISPVFRPGAGLTLGYYDNGDLTALIRAFNASTDSNIISTPTIVALDNEEAELLVGQNVPFITGQATGQAADTTNPFTTIQRQDIGTTLKIKPQINRGDSITLELLQTTENIAASVEVASDIITNKRSISTKALIRDEQILVIGGLLQETAAESRQKVPVLGNIPVLGRLFSSSDKSNIKTNLMVFIHPTILRGDDRVREATRSRYEIMREKQAALGERRIFEEFAAPDLPEFETITPRGSVWPGDG